MPNAKAEIALDHLLLGVNDLNHGIAWLQERTGLRAATGGIHPGLGTCNALLSLGHRQYIEIVAIDPQQTSYGPTAALIQDLTVPRLINWAAATSDILGIRGGATSTDYSVGGPVDGSRVRPDGRTLKWRTVTLTHSFGGVIPFFIAWAEGTVHPSIDSPSGGGLVTFELEHPQAVRVREVLRELGIDAVVSSGLEPRLRAILTCPAGTIELR
jgi:hypothetical protein